MAQATARRLAATETHSVCAALLQRCLELTGATLGNIQLVDWRAGELRIVSQVGFRPDFLRAFEWVKYQDSCACARALATRAAVVIRDVMSDAGFAPYRDIAHRAGFRAVQSTPLLSSSSALVGIVSTHYSAAHAPTARELTFLHEIGRFTADAIIAQRARTRLPSQASWAVQPEVEKAEGYRHSAAECRERAFSSRDTAVRRQFLELAEQWHELAHQLERGEIS